MGRQPRRIRYTRTRRYVFEISPFEGIAEPQRAHATVTIIFNIFNTMSRAAADTDADAHTAVDTGPASPSRKEGDIRRHVHEATAASASPILR